MVNARDAYAIGCSHCSSTAPSPDYDASHSIVTGFWLSKYFNTGKLLMILLILSNCFWWFSVHYHALSFLSRSRNIFVSSESLLKNLDKYCIIPRNYFSSVILPGDFNYYIASILLGSGRTPYLLIICPIYLTSSLRNFIFSLLIFKLFYLHLLNTLLRFSSWSFLASSSV